jgi:cytochrome P450
MYSDLVKICNIEDESCPGPIVHFQVFKRHIIILDNLQAVLDLFEKRSKIYCGRPQTEMTKMVGRDASVILSQPGERLNEYRKLLRAWLNPEQVNLHYPVQREEVLRYLSVLSNSYEGAESVFHHSRR